MFNKLVIIILMFGCVTCAQTCLAKVKGPIVVLLSGDEEAYHKPVVTFGEEMQRPIQLFNLHGDIKNNPDLKKKVMSTKPALIFAMGAKAAYAAKLWTSNRQDIPVLFAMVLNWQRYHLLDQQNVTGIAAETAPGTQFVNMSVISSNIRRIGIVLSRYSSEILIQARKNAKLLGLELETSIIQRPRDFKRAFKKMATQVDAYWVVNDPVIYTLSNIDWLKERCLKEKMLCVGQSSNSAKFGLALTFNPDYIGVAYQAASMAKNILAGNKNPAQFGVMPPLATQITLNHNTSQFIGLKLTPRAMNMITKIIN